MDVTRRRFMGGAVTAGAMLAAGSLLAGVTDAAAASPATAKTGAKNGPVLLKNVTVGAAKNINVLVADGVIKAMGPNVTGDKAEVVDCKGALLLPSFMDPHVHLDKTRIGGPRLHHAKTATVAERAANERRLRKELNHDPFIFGSNLVRQVALMGTTHIRSHIDVDTDVKLRHVEAILKVREKFKGFMDIQLVAFPQSGIVKSPGTAELMLEAVRMGVDIVGGLDPQTYDNDVKGHLDAVFGIAEKTGAGLDLHLHEPGEVGLTTFKAIAERTRALGMKNKVNLSHAYALGQIPKADLEAILAQFVELGISVATSAPGAVNFAPVEPLLNAGILYSGMSDNIQDMWSPWGNGDQLERAMFLGYRNNFRADEPLMRCFDMVTKNPAKLMGVPGHSLADIKVGFPANLTAVVAEDVEAAVLQRPARLFTMKDGRFIARGGKVLMPA